MPFTSTVGGHRPNCVCIDISYARVCFWNFWIFPNHSEMSKESLHFHQNSKHTGGGEDMQPSYHLSRWKVTIEPLIGKKKIKIKRERQGTKGLNSPFYWVAEMLLTCWFACRRKMMYSRTVLTWRMRATSRQPGEEAQPQLDQTEQLHLPHPRGWGGGQRGAPERGCCPKRPWSPLLHPSLFRRGCALFPRRDGHNLA